MQYIQNCYKIHQCKSNNPSQYSIISRIHLKYQTYLFCSEFGLFCYLIFIELDLFELQIVI